MTVNMPKNAVGWERMFALCKKQDVFFNLVDAVEPNGPQWKTTGDTVLAPQ